MGYSSFGVGPCLAEGVLCFELCEQRLTPPMSNSLFVLAGIKRCIFSVFLLGFRTFYPLHVLKPHKINREPSDLFDTGPLVAFYSKRDGRHASARDSFARIARGETPYRKFYTSDYALDESLTLFRSETGNHKFAVELGSDIF